MSYGCPLVLCRKGTSNSNFEHFEITGNSIFERDVSNTFVNGKRLCFICLFSAFVIKLVDLGLFSQRFSKLAVSI